MISEGGLSAFGVDHGVISKKRDRKGGAKLGAGIGAGIAGANYAANAGMFRNVYHSARTAGAGKAKIIGSLGTGAAIGTGIMAGGGAGVGAAIGRKKKEH